MIEEVQRTGFLDHAQVIGHLLAADATLVAYNDGGNPVVAPAVLKAFGKRPGDEIVWSRSALHWRLRDPADIEGRVAP